VGVRRSHKNRVGGAVNVEIIRVASAPDDQPVIFLAAHRIADPGVSRSL